jgi:hypothetical protein
MNELKNNIYEKIKDLQGIRRVQTAFELLKMK